MRSRRLTAPQLSRRFVAGLLAGLSLSLQAGAAPAAAKTTLQGMPSLSLSGPAKEGDLLASLPPPAAGPKAAPDVAKPKPRVLIVTMFEPEAKPWRDRLGPWTRTRIAGLSEDYPWLRCNRDQVCLVTTGMGHSNAAASALALVLSNKVDLRHSYILIAGIAAINPEQGTLGTPAWARYLVDWGLQWELDAREAPPEWPTGYLGINTRHPDEKPPLDYRTEVFEVNGPLVRKALALSKDEPLLDSPAAQAARARYPQAPANQPPRVVQCDTMSGDTWVSGHRLGARATTWVSLMTNGAGKHCTSQQEDNATFEALLRGAKLGRVDLGRVMVLRAGSDFDRPAPGDSAVSNLLDYPQQGGFDIAIENLYRAGLPVVQAISKHWRSWKDGSPAH